MGFLSYCLGGTPVPVAPNNGEREAGEHDDPEKVKYANGLVKLLTLGQQEELYASFSRFDVDGNGSIDAEEIGTVMSQVGTPQSLEQINELLSCLDKSGNGTVEWSEFATAVAEKWLAQDGDADIQMAVGIMSSKKDTSQIDLNTMRNLMCNHGDSPLSSAEWEEFLKMVDPGSTGNVSAESFRALPCWNPRNELGTPPPSPPSSPPSTSPFPSPPPSPTPQSMPPMLPPLTLPTTMKIVDGRIPSRKTRSRRRHRRLQAQRATEALVTKWIAQYGQAGSGRLERAELSKLLEHLHPLERRRQHLLL